MVSVLLEPVSYRHLTGQKFVGRAALGHAVRALSASVRGAFSAPADFTFGESL